MHTKKSIMEDLQKSGINPKGTLLIHSSMKAVGECENRGDTVIDAFIEYMSEGLLIFPTHTWKQINEKYNTFDPLTEPSCVGILTNLFLKRANVIRSLHPTHSVTAIGKDAVDFTNGEEFHSTPCSRNGCYGKLYDRNAQILFLGCDLSRNTYLHGVEEWNDIPNRLTEKPQELFIKIKDSVLPCPQYRHYCPECEDISKNYIKMEKPFIETGAASYCKIGDAHSVICDAVKMADLVSRCLKKETDLFVNNDSVKEELYE